MSLWRPPEASQSSWRWFCQIVTSLDPLGIFEWSVRITEDRMCPQCNRWIMRSLCPLVVEAGPPQTSASSCHSDRSLCHREHTSLNSLRVCSGQILFPVQQLWHIMWHFHFDPSERMKVRGQNQWEQQRFSSGWALIQQRMKSASVFVKTEPPPVYCHRSSTSFNLC